jgi:hypothetical protein
LPYYSPLYQLKFEMNCIIAIVKVSLCAKGPQPFGTTHEIVWFVSTNKLENVNHDC